MKYIFVTGGVLSGIGKGVCASSIGRILKNCGMRPTHLKIDPYLNIDAGTMSPFEHGEVFVLDDGGETDLDLGNYERFVDIKLTQFSNLTTGKIYQKVIQKERKGDYLGKTVQIVPHLTNEIQQWIRDVAKMSVDENGEEPDVCITELGGTVGDIESAPFVEALRQFHLKEGSQNCVFCHVSLIPEIQGEQKSKPTQHSVSTLKSLGISPDFLFCRSDTPLLQSTIDKISMFTQVANSRVLSIYNVPNIFHVPTIMTKQNFSKQLGEIMNLGTNMTPNLSSWETMANHVVTLEQEVHIAIVGKYTGKTSNDAYLSVIKSLEHAASAVDRKLSILWVEADKLVDLDGTNQEKYNEAWAYLKKADGIVVPGGFGLRGMEGKIRAVQYCRETNKPFLGICLGMQAAVIEYARNVCNLKGAQSEEFDKEAVHKLVMFMPEGDKEQMGGTMRLGARETILKTDSLAYELYGKQKISERHRHRYEVNAEYVQQLENKGLIFSGKNMDSESNGERMEVVELPNLHFFIAAQYHPEFQSRPNRPSPLFLGLLKAATQTDVDLQLQNQVSLTNRDSPRKSTTVSNEFEQKLTPSKPPTKKRDQKALKKQLDKSQK